MANTTPHPGAGGPTLQSVINVLNDLASVDNRERAAFPQEVRDFCKSVADWAGAFELGMMNVVDSFEASAEAETIREARDVVLQLAPRIAKLAHEAQDIEPPAAQTDPRLRAVTPTNADEPAPDTASPKKAEATGPSSSQAPDRQGNASVSEIRAEMAEWRRQRAEERRARAEKAAKERAEFVASLRAGRDASSEGAPKPAEKAQTSDTPEPASSDPAQPEALTKPEPRRIQRKDAKAAPKAPPESEQKTSAKKPAPQKQTPTPPDPSARFKRTDTDAQSTPAAASPPDRTSPEAPPEAEPESSATSRFRFRRADDSEQGAQGDASARTFRVARSA